MNESIYYNVDMLHTAIGEGRAVSFRYFDYNSRKEKVFRREGQRYLVSPYGLVWDNENYYLVGYAADHGQVRHYRVDKMSGIDVTDPLPEGASGGTFDMAGYAQKHFGMFSGADAVVTLRCREGLAGVVLDRFGQEAMLIPGDDETFTVTVTVVVSPQFWGWLFGLGSRVELLSPPGRWRSSGRGWETRRSCIKIKANKTLKGTGIRDKRYPPAPRRRGILFVYAHSFHTSG